MQEREKGAEKTTKIIRFIQKWLEQREATTTFGNLLLYILIKYVYTT